MGESMGASVSTARSVLLGRVEKCILMVGTDNSGKTVILYRLKLNKTVPTNPTIGKLPLAALLNRRVQRGNHPLQAHPLYFLGRTWPGQDACAAAPL